MNSKPRFQPKMVDDVPEITPDVLLPYIDQSHQANRPTLIDVRRPEEFVGELSHVPGSRLITLGPDLDAFLAEHDKNDEIVFICRSGARSGRATVMSRAMGFQNTVNLQGGMLLWNSLKFPVSKE